MRRIIYRVCVIGSILMLLMIMSPGISGLFGDKSTTSLKLKSSSLNLEIKDFNVTLNNQLLTLNETNQFDSMIKHDEIMDIQFTLNNLSPFNIDVEGFIELSFVNDANEKSVLYLYPITVDDESIKLDPNKDAIIGTDEQDNTTLSDTSSNRNGIVKKIVSDSLFTPEGTGNSVKSKTYTFKLFIDGSNLTKEDLIAQLRDNKIGIGLLIYATGQGNTSTWNTSIAAYGEISTGVTIEKSLDFYLKGEEIIYIAQNTVYEDLGYVALNELNEEVVATKQSNVDTTQCGSYQVSYTINYNGIEKTLVRKVIVTDGENPQIIPLFDKQEKFVSRDLDLKTLVNVKDNVDDQNLKEKLVVTKPDDFDSMKPGVYPICYNLTDNSGLKADETCLELTIFAYKEVAPMYDTTIALTTHGRVYTWGYSGNGETGRNTKNTLPTPGEVTTLNQHTIIQITGGKYFGMALSDEGKLFIWGYDGEGAQGNKESSKHNLVPQEIVIDSQQSIKFVQISRGKHTAAALTEEGTVYIWGDSDNYATGQNNETDVVTPKILEFPNNAKIKYIALGFMNGFAIDDQNNVYAWGKNAFGINDNNTSIRVPILINAKLENINVDSKISTNSDVTGIPNIKEIAAGTDHCYILMEDGRLYAWGDNSHGQLGDSTKVTPVAKNNVPKRMSHFGSDVIIETVAAGDNYGVALTQEGIAYAWGHSMFGSFAENHNTNHPTPIIKMPQGVTKLTAIGAYYATTGLITSEGYLYMSGSNNYGELGIGTIGADKYTWVKTLNP